MKRFLAVPSLTILLGSLLPAQSPTSASFDRLFEQWNKNGSPGCAVAVARGDRVLRVACYGVRDIDTGEPITPNTAFYSASVSKQFVAASVAHLARAGALSLDDEVRRYVPELPDLGVKVTVRHLVHHRSGLREMFDLVAWAGWSADIDLTPDKMLGLLSKQKELNFAPGSDFLYCNTGYFLLGVIVGRASNSSLRAYSSKHLFGPLGMTRSVFKDDPDQKIKEAAVGHHKRRDGRWVAHRTRFALVGSGGLFTTVTDLVKWLQNFDDKKWGGDGLVEQLQTPPKLEPSQRLSPTTGPYAFGLTRGSHRGFAYVGHAGGSFGFRAHTVRFPEQKLYVALLANTSNLQAPKLAMAVADLYLGAGAEPVGASAVKQGKVGLGGPRTFREPASGDLALLVPRPDGARLATLSWQVEMLAAGKDVLRSRDAQLPVTAKLSDDALVVEVEGETPRRFAAVSPPELSRGDLSNYMGNYESEELGSSFEVVREGRSLRIKGKEMKFLPVAEDVMAANRGGQLDFVRDATGKITGVRVSTDRSRRMLFRRVK